MRWPRAVCNRTGIILVRFASFSPRGRADSNKQTCSSYCSANLVLKIRNVSLYIHINSHNGLLKRRSDGYRIQDYYILQLRFMILLFTSCSTTCTHDSTTQCTWYYVAKFQNDYYSYDACCKLAVMIVLRPSPLTAHPRPSYRPRRTTRRRMTLPRTWRVVYAVPPSCSYL